MRIVLDTNVLVSGLLNARGHTGRIVDLVVAGRLRVLYDDRILAEYRDVLARPELGLSQDDVRDVLRALVAAGELVAAQLWSAALPDPDDAPFLEVASAGLTDALVTGNLRHFPARARGGVNVCTPAELMEALGGSR